MAKVINNPVVRGISGGIGNMVFRQMPNGETWVSEKQNFDKRKFSKGQKEHQSRFQQAAAYAREAAKTQPIYAQLAAGTVKSPYNWALSDWFHPPMIRSIERKDGKIRINATDNVLVSKVVVRVLDAEGHVLEKGEGIRAEGDWWDYVCNTNGKVIAEAWDLAGNKVISSEP
jgi:hypothetical protein